MHVGEGLYDLNMIWYGMIWYDFHFPSKHVLYAKLLKPESEHGRLCVLNIQRPWAWNLCGAQGDGWSEGGMVS